MVTFTCDNCNESLKKNKVDQHWGKCRNDSVSCIDCSKTFFGNEYAAHTSCVSEAEKYEKTLYKGPKKADEHKKEVKQAKKAEASSEPAAEAAAVETKATNGKKRAREDSDAAAGAGAAKAAKTSAGSSAASESRPSVADAVKAVLAERKESGKALSLKKLRKAVASRCEGVEEADLQQQLLDALIAMQSSVAISWVGE